MATIDEIDGVKIAKLLSKVKEESRVMTAEAGDVDYSGYGFQPTTIESVGTLTTTRSEQWGYCDSAGAVKALLYNAVTTTYEVSDNFMNFIESSGVWHKVTAVVFNADGFTLTWAKSGAPDETAEFIIRALR